MLFAADYIKWCISQVNCIPGHNHYIPGRSALIHGPWPLWPGTSKRRVGRSRRNKCPVSTFGELPRIPSFAWPRCRP